MIFEEFTRAVQELVRTSFEYGLKCEDLNQSKEEKNET